MGISKEFALNWAAVCRWGGEKRSEKDVAKLCFELYNNLDAMPPEKVMFFDNFDSALSEINSLYPEVVGGERSMNYRISRSLARFRVLFGKEFMEKLLLYWDQANKVLDKHVGGSFFDNNHAIFAKSHPIFCGQKMYGFFAACDHVCEYKKDGNFGAHILPYINLARTGHFFWFYPNHVFVVRNIRSPRVS